MSIYNLLGNSYSNFNSTSTSNVEEIEMTSPSSWGRSFDTITENSGQMIASDVSSSAIDRSIAVDVIPQANEFGETDATSQIDETEEVTEGVEAVEAASSVADANLAYMLGQAVSAGTVAISNAADQKALGAARGDYYTAMSNGHGIGYQNIAENNLNNMQTSIGLHGAITQGLGLLGPVGALIGALIPSGSFAGPSDTSFTAQTTSEQDVNAQDPEIVNTT